MSQIKVILFVSAIVGALAGVKWFTGVLDERAEFKTEAETANARADGNERALMTFAENANETIAADVEAKQELQDNFNKVLLENIEFQQQVDSHDYEKLARVKPDILERVINRGIRRMHDKVRAVTGYTETGENGTTGKAVASEPAIMDN